MLAQHDIRRHPDGSMDFDFYRRRAARLRAEARREWFKAKAVPVVRTAVAAAIVAAALCVVPAVNGTGWSNPGPSRGPSAAPADPLGAAAF